MAVSVWIETRQTPKGERYRVVWREVAFDAEGRPQKGPRRKLPQVSDPVRAQKQKLAKISELEDVEAGLKPKARLRTWGEISREYLNHAEMRIPKSYDHLVKPAVDLFTAFIKRETLADNIDAGSLISYEKHLRALEPKNKPGQRYGENTIRRLLKDLRTCLRFAYRHGWMRDLPRLSLPAARDSERLPTPAEVAALRATVGPAYHLAVGFLASTGLRLNELLAVDGKDFRWNAEEGYWEVRARILKRKEDDPTKIKVVPLQRALAADLALPRPAGAVFPFKEWALQNAMAEAGTLLKIEPVSPHDLRHYWATRFMEATGDLYALMRLGGWKDIKSVMKYQHLTRGRSKAILAVDFLVVDPGQPPGATESPSGQVVLRS